MDVVLVVVGVLDGVVEEVVEEVEECDGVVVVASWDVVIDGGES